jgi:hypothetical protein
VTRAWTAGVVALALVASGCVAPRYRVVEEQLGRRTWEVRAGDWWPGAAGDLERFILYRAAERTRATGLRYFAVREFNGDAARYRAFAADTGDPRQGRYPPVGRWADVAAGRDRIDYFLKTPYSELRTEWKRLKFRMLDDADLDRHLEVVDSAKVLGHLAPLIDRRR